METYNPDNIYRSKASHIEKVFNIYQWVEKPDTLFINSILALINNIMEGEFRSQESALDPLVASPSQ
ncbi:hypothetical protein MEO40_14045 [Dolichospermum sp. ST_sed1]|nr:hypothetical protein [Dolichospermum sp. ST_sed1]MDD1437048.1 hypothetical protein [Dolichospermum sp. ST_sed10]